MHNPNYAEYSLAQLGDCLNHINRDKYPDRYQLLLHEISLRTERGEAVCDPLINELTGADIPFSLALRLWLCFCWRYTICSAGVAALFMASYTAMNRLYILSPLIVGLMVAATIALLILSGAVIMKQALARPYRPFRIRVTPAAVSTTDSLLTQPARSTT
ncbi:hypothetical protein [Desulfosediminicola sp.]|uniref:hypothetical protein n=1 Tax=Desulfosediminicola sp. TaxID=2886825 RepID=UPI003AF222CD